MRFITITLLVFGLLVNLGFSFIAPLPDTIQSISVPLSEDVAITIDELRKAAVPQSVNTAIAIAISGGVAGVVGGAVSRKTADFLGDKKKDSLQTKLSTTGAFFGTRGLVRGIATIMGFPRPLVLLCSSLAASLVSEFAKQQGRTRSQDIEGSSSDEERGLQGSEITGDITKWLVYDYLEDEMKRVMHIDDNFPQMLFATFGVGCVAAAVSFVVKELGSKLDSFDSKSAQFSPLSSTTNIAVDSDGDNKLPLNVRFIDSAIEGGVLFATFQATLSVINMIVPPDLNKPFVFNSLIETIEKTIDPDLM